MPLSRNPHARRRQLANLRPGNETGAAATPGNTRSLQHGAFARVSEEQMQAQVARIFDALAQDAPLREADGGLPAADSLPVRLLAEVLARLTSISEFLHRRGWQDESGNVRPVVEVESRLRREAMDYAEAMGMTPRARARLGLDLVHGRASLIEQMEADYHAEREADEGAADRVDVHTMREHGNGDDAG